VGRMGVGVLLDTSILLAPPRFRVDVFEEAGRVLEAQPEFYVSTRVLEELGRLREEASPGFSRELEVAMALARRCRVLVDESAGPVDDSLIQLASTRGLVLATADGELRRRARRRGVRVLYLRQRRYLELDG